MKIRKLLDSGGKYNILILAISASFMSIKHLVQIFSNNLFAGEKIVLEGKAKIAINHKTNLKLVNSKIIVEKGVFKVGIHYGYYDGGTFDSKRDVCRIHLLNSTLRIKGNVDLYPGVQIFAYNAEISIGEETKINGLSQIIAFNKVEIGSHCCFAQGVLIRDNDGHKFSLGDQSPVMNIIPVKVGNHCWVGERAMILKGVTLEENVVVAAGSIVTKNAEQGSLIAGVPARKIKDHIKWEA